MSGVNTGTATTDTVEDIATVIPIVHSGQSTRSGRLRAANAAPVTATHEAPVLQPTPLLRSSAMLLINEDLARARMREMEQAAEEHRRAYRVLAARRSQRRARQVARRARLVRP